MSVAHGQDEPVSSAPIVELTPPDIGPFRDGNTGIPYATTFDSHVGGPHVVVCALTHGNEISGAIALEHVFRHEVRPDAGKLTLVFMNTAAYGLFDRARPTTSRYVDEDLNRLWTDEHLRYPRRSIEGHRARELRPLMDSADMLLDLHSMQTGQQPIYLCGPSAKGRILARRVGGRPVIVSDVGHGDGTRLRDYGRFNTPGDRRNALLAECGPHWRNETAETAIETVYRFLRASGVVRNSELPIDLPEAPPADEWIEVTDRFVPESENARFAEKFSGLDRISEAGTVIAHDGPRDIRTPYDDCVLVMPARRLVAGHTAVRLGRVRSFNPNAR